MERRRDARRRAEKKAWKCDYFSTHPCVDCGEADPIVLEFDHRFGENKLFEIGALSRNKGWKAILLEVSKCDVRCANCHRRRHARDGYQPKAKLPELPLFGGTIQ